MSLLLSPVTIGHLALSNRVVMSPMCMYEVAKEDGMLTPFHFVHYGARAISKVGLIIIEATGVTPDGRISSRDLGLWNDDQAAELTKLTEMLHSFGSKVGIQLNHAGRKAEQAERLIAPSAIAYNEEYGIPDEMTLEDIQNVQKSFVSAAKRAQQSGVDVIELHGAHGYLGNQFLSPATNKRSDRYGGSLLNRYRFLEEIIAEIRTFFTGSLWMRLSLTDYADADSQNSLAEWQELATWLERDGINLLDVSTGGLLDRQPNIPIHDGYQVSYATWLKKAVSIPVSAVGLLDNPGLCEYILQNKQADLIMEGRALLRNTNWLKDAAVALHDETFKVYNQSYQRGQK